MHIFKHGHAGEDVGDLKGTADPLADDPVGRQPRNPFAVEEHFTCVRLQQPGHHIEQGRFSGPVRPDDCVNLTFSYREIYLPERPETSEVLRDAVELEKSQVRSHPILTNELRAFSLK